MAERTGIEWADSTLNLQMGCDGCELTAEKDRPRCYAKVLTDRRTGSGPQHGWPTTFEQPALFPQRLDAALRWRDLTGTVRLTKPWLSGRPRHIFLNDMGDTWTESLPLTWLAEFLPRMAASPHVWMVLTKRPHRAAAFAARHPFPPNVMVGTSVTGRATKARAHVCAGIPAARRFLSIEPLWDDPGFTAEDLAPFALVILGGESGPHAKPCDVGIIRRLLLVCRLAGASPFVKQLGTRPYSMIGGYGEPHFAAKVASPHDPADAGRWYLRGQRDRKGADMAEWPEDLRVREFPR